MTDWVMYEFLSEDNIPTYAILSHTWEKEEVTYQEWESSAIDENIRSKSGYKKIKDFGRRAATDGYEWIWVDTSALLSPFVIYPHRFPLLCANCFSRGYKLTLFSFVCIDAASTRKAAQS